MQCLASWLRLVIESLIKFVFIIKFNSFFLQEWKAPYAYTKEKITVPLIEGDKIWPEAMPPFRNFTNQSHPKVKRVEMFKFFS